MRRQSPRWPLLRSPRIDGGAIADILHGNLRRVLDDGGNVAAREAMLEGSLLAGMAFANAPVGAVHALAYPLGARFHLPHGLCNALMLPHVLAFNLETNPELYAPLADAILPLTPGRSRSEAGARLRRRNESTRCGRRSPGPSFAMPRCLSQRCRRWPGMRSKSNFFSATIPAPSRSTTHSGFTARRGDRRVRRSGLLAFLESSRPQEIEIERTRPLVARSARTSPMTLANLKPWPEKPQPI